MPSKREPKYQKCCMCCENITNPGAVVAYGDLMHHSCFVCKTCKQWIRGGEEYTQVMGVITCLQCMLKVPKDTCKGCTKALDDRVIQAMNHYWHYKCFKCETCGRPLADSGFFVIDGKPYCAEHFYALKGKGLTQRL